MEIVDFRDWIIVIWGIVGILATVVLVTLALIVFRKVTRVLDKANETVENVRETSSVVSKNVIQPIAKVQGFMTGLRKAVDVVTSLSNKEGEKDVKR